MFLARTKKRNTPEISNERIAAGGTFLLALAAVALTVKLIRNRTQRAVDSSPRLHTDRALAEEVRRVARLEVDAAIAALTSGDETVPAKGVHEARKSIKKLRSLLRLTRHEIGEKVFKAENKSLRRIARRLSDSRDSDVMVQTLDSITTEYADEVPDGAFDGLRDALEIRATTERSRLALHAAAMRGGVSELHAVRARVAGWPLPEDGTMKDLVPGVRDIYKNGRDASDAAYARPTTERIHRLRRRTKDVVHTAQFLDEASPRAAKIAQKGKQVNELLGTDHDLAILSSGAANYSETLALGSVELLQALIERRRVGIQREATEQAALLYSKPPKKIITRFIAKR